jgi:hypothetical protein
LGSRVTLARVTLPEKFCLQTQAFFEPLATATLALGLPYLLVNRDSKTKTKTTSVHIGEITFHSHMKT